MPGRENRVSWSEMLRLTSHSGAPDAVPSEVTQEIDSLARQLGYQWPPRDREEAALIFRKAGFGMQRVEQLLNRFGYAGFEGLEELPPGYSLQQTVKIRPAAPTASERDSEWTQDLENVGPPILFSMLAEGLRAAVEQSGGDLWLGWRRTAEYAHQLGVTVRQINRIVAEGERDGTAERNGRLVNLRQSRAGSCR